MSSSLPHCGGEALRLLRATLNGRAAVIPKGTEENELAQDTLRQLLEDICYCLHHHEVQTWKDCPGTDPERMAIALGHAREALGLLTGKSTSKDAREYLADHIQNRDLAASGGILASP